MTGSWACGRQSLEVAASGSQLAGRAVGQQPDQLDHRALARVGLLAVALVQGVDQGLRARAASTEPARSVSACRRTSSRMPLRKRISWSTLAVLLHLQQVGGVDLAEEEPGSPPRW